MIVGVDYAAVDGNAVPDWMRLRNACTVAGSRLGFAIIRGAWGTTIDMTFVRDAERAKDAGLVVGSYLFLRMPQSGFSASPEDQVFAFSDNVRLGSGCLPPVIDIEEPWHVAGGAQAELEWIHRAWVAMIDIFGIPPMLYTSNRVWTEDLHNLPAGDLLDSALWLAKPWPWSVRTAPHLAPGPFAGGGYDPVVPMPWGPKNWWIHQYQGDARPVPGFSSTVDLSRFHNMVEGETGPRVEWVQRRLGMVASGVFDPAMASRVRAFQKARGLAVDAIVGPRTFCALAWVPREFAPGAA